MTVCSSGELINATEKGDKKTYFYTLKNARDFAFVLSSEFYLLTKTENGVTTVDADGLAMVYPLNPMTEIAYLTRGTAAGTLHLYTKEDGHPVLTVIDTETMQTVQQLKLESEVCEFFSLLHASEEFIVLITDSSRLVLLTRKEDGMYAHRFTADKEPAGIELPYYGTTHTKCAFDGERLATVQYIRDGYARCNLIAAVYDATGMLSAARYDCSLNAGLSDDNYKYHCQLTGDPVIAIRFTD